MEFVIDTNCLVSALIVSGKSREIICSIKLSLYAPEELLSETIAHKEEIVVKSRLTSSDFDILVNVLLSNISVIPMDEYKHLKEEALALVKHPEDAPFIALSLSKKIPLWSDDKALKEQSVVKVYSTSELLELFK